MRKFLIPVLLSCYLVCAGCRDVPATTPVPEPESGLIALAPGTRYFPATAPANGDVAVVVHGLFRGSGNLNKIARALAERGYRVYSFEYQSTRRTLPEHGAALRTFLVAIARAYPKAKIDLVTHSMGALLTRYALAHLDENAPDGWKDPEAARALPAERFGRIVMIAPPNRGSNVAKNAVRFVPGWEYLVKPLDDLSSAPSALPTHLPQVAAIPTGVITARYDIAVAPGLTDYPAATDATTLGVTHSFSVYSNRVRDAVVRFLECGSFEEAIPCSTPGD